MQLIPGHWTSRLVHAVEGLASDVVPLVRRAVEASERAADAATLSALKAHFDFLAIPRGEGPLEQWQARENEAARAIACAGIYALGRRIAIRAGAETSGDEPPHADPSAAERQRAYRDRKRTEGQ